MKRVLVCLMIIGLILGSVACTKKTSTENETNPTNQKQVELKFQSWRFEEVEAFNKLNSEFNKEYPNIKVVYEPIKATEYDKSIITNFSANAAPDILYVRPFDRGENLFETGNIIELDDAKIPNLKNVSDTQKKVYMDKNGKIFAVPYIYVSYGFMYNKNIFDKYSLKEPETWDEFYAILNTLKSKGVIPLALGTKDSWVINEVVSNGNYQNFTNGEEWRQAMLKGTKDFKDAGFVNNLRNLAKWKDYLPEAYSTVGYVEAQQLFLSGKAAIFSAGSWEIGYFASQNPSFEIGMFGSPVVKKGDKKWIGFNGGAGIGVSKDTKNLNEALIYINWLMSEKAQIMAGNLMSGLYPCANISNDKIENALAKKWISLAGSSGENFAVGWSLEKVSKKEPAAGTLISEGIVKLFNGEMTPEQVANYIQQGVSSWYEPLKK